MLPCPRVACTTGRTVPRSTAWLGWACRGQCAENFSLTPLGRDVLQHVVHGTLCEAPALTRGNRGSPAPASPRNESSERLTTSATAPGAACRPCPAHRVAP